MGVGDINLIAKIAPYNDGFVGMVHADQIIGVNGTISDTANGGFVPSDAVNDIDNLDVIYSLNLPVYAGEPDPSATAEGDIYYNSTDKNIYRYDGTTWLSSDSSSSHNSLLGIQGGALDDYYHFTQSQHDTLTDGSNADALHVHSGTSSAHNDLTGLQGGATGEYYHLIEDKYNLINRLDEDSAGLTFDGVSVGSGGGEGTTDHSLLSNLNWSLSGHILDTNLITSGDNTYDLGSSSFNWKDLYLGNTLYLGSNQESFIYYDGQDLNIGFSNPSIGILTQKVYINDDLLVEGILTIGSSSIQIDGDNSIISSSSGTININNNLEVENNITGEKYYVDSTDTYLQRGNWGGSVYYISGVVDGVESFRADKYGFLVNDGESVSPSFSFISDPNTGFYLSGTSQVTLSLGGSTKQIEFDIPNGVNLDGLNLTTSGSINIDSNSSKLYFGDNQETSIYFDGTDLNVDLDNPSIGGVIKLNDDVEILGQLSVDTQIGTMVFSTGSITDSSGTISFNDENLITTGTITASKVVSNLNSKLNLEFKSTGWELNNEVATGVEAPVIESYSFPAIGINDLYIGNSFYDTNILFQGFYGTSMSYDWGLHLWIYYTNTKNNDSIQYLFGTGSDTSIYFNGTRWIFDSNAYGTNQLNINSNNVFIGNSALTYNNADSQFRMDYSVDLNGVAANTTTNRYGFYNVMSIKNSADSSQQMGHFNIISFQSNYDLTDVNDAIRVCNNILVLSESASGGIASGTITTSRFNYDSDYTGDVGTLNAFRFLNNGVGSSISVDYFNGFLIDPIAFEGVTNCGIQIGDVTGATSNYAIKTGMGLVSLGDDVHISNNNDKLYFGDNQESFIYYDGQDINIGFANPSIGDLTQKVVINDDLLVEGNLTANKIIGINVTSGVDPGHTHTYVGTLHNTLTDLQGGATGEYYHLIEDKYNLINRLDEDSAGLTFDGVSVGSGGGAGTTDHSLLSNLSWSTSGHILDTNLITSGDNTYDLGSSSFNWKDLYLGNTLYLGSNQESFIYYDGQDLNIGFSNPSIGLLTQKVYINDDLLVEGILTIGSSSIQIDGDNSIISSTSGTISFDNENLTTTGNILINADSSKLYFGATQDASIYYDGSISHVDSDSIRMEGRVGVLIDPTTTDLMKVADTLTSGTLTGLNVYPNITVNADSQLYYGIAFTVQVGSTGYTTSKVSAALAKIALIGGTVTDASNVDTVGSVLWTGTSVVDWKIFNAAQYALGSNGTIENYYGYYAGDITKGTNNWAIYTNEGNVHFGDDVDTIGNINIDSNSSRLYFGDNQESFIYYDGQDLNIGFSNPSIGYLTQKVYINDDLLVEGILTVGSTFVNGNLVVDVGGASLTINELSLFGGLLLSPELSATTLISLKDTLYVRGSGASSQIFLTNSDATATALIQYLTATHIIKFLNASAYSFDNDIYTTGAGDDFWLGSTTQTSAYFQAYATGEVRINADNQKLLIGASQDTSIYFNAEDLIINSENVTADDEIHFTNFTKYTFDNDIEVTGDLTISGNIKKGSASLDIRDDGMFYTDGDGIEHEVVFKDNFCSTS